MIKQEQEFMLHILCKSYEFELIGILNEDDNEDILSTFAKLLESDLK